MKKFYKVTCGLIIAGLVLIGIGSAVCVSEVRSFKYMGYKYADNDEIIVENKEITLPDNLGKILYYRSYDIEIVKDDTLAGNTAVVEMSHLKSADDVNLDIEIRENMYLRNDNTDNYSKYPVNILDTVYYNNYSGESEFQTFLTFLNDIKNREIYDYYANPEIKFVLKVSPEAYERFDVVPDSYSVLDEGMYRDEIHMRELEEEEEIREAEEEARKESMYDEDTWEEEDGDYGSGEYNGE